MRGRVVVSLVVVVAGAHCSLTSLDGLSGGTDDAGAPDVVADAPIVPNNGGHPDAAPDADADAPIGSAQLVQKVTLSYTSTTATVAQLAKPVTAGNLLAAVMLTHNNPDSGPPYGISDSLGNTWKSTTYRTCAASSAGLQIWYVESSNAGVDAVTVTQATVGSSRGELGLGVFEYAGLAGSATLDVEASQCAPTSSPSMFTQSVTTTHPDLLLGAFVDPCGQGTMTVGTGWSLVDILPAYYYLLEERTSVPAGLYQATATDPQTANCWLAAIAAFKLR
jgi:hypothetical protein